MISATVSGHLGRDAETKEVGNTIVTAFSIASNAYRNKEKVTDWVNVSFWGERGEKLAQYLTKGAYVVVRGQMWVRPYESKGEQKFSLEVRADDIELGGKSADGGSQGAGGGGTGKPKAQQRQQQRQEEPADDAPPEDDIPFAHCDVGRRGGERWWR
jgi:single-strand DNA-binding protein